MKSLFTRIRTAFSAAREALAVRAEVKDGPTAAAGWESLTRAGGGPADRPWAELQQEFSDVLEAWRLNGWVRQVVRLITAYTVGDGLKLSSSVPEVNDFLQQFWQHPENRLDRRLPAWCDELSRAGELFPILFTNKIDGMSQVRLVPASCIRQVETDPQDYEKELAYVESVPGQLEGKRWASRRTARPFARRADGRSRRPEPMMLHYTINQVVGASRGESDLTPLLPWAQRYTAWLKERVRFNRIRNTMALLWVQLKDGSQVESKRAQYRADPPGEGSIFVTGPDEEIKVPDANIRGWDASPDGKALRLAMATASNLSLVHFGEGDTANRSTTVSMDDRTFRFYRQRQQEFGAMLVDLCSWAFRRRQQVVSGQPLPPELPDLGIVAEFADISRSDNKELAEAARALVSALAQLKESLDLGAKFDEVALRLAFKFAGELLPEAEILAILQGTREQGTPGGGAGEQQGRGAG